MSEKDDFSKKLIIRLKQQKRLSSDQKRIEGFLDKDQEKPNFSNEKTTENESRPTSVDSVNNQKTTQATTLPENNNVDNLNNNRNIDTIRNAASPTIPETKDIADEEQALTSEDVPFGQDINSFVDKKSNTNVAPSERTKQEMENFKKAQLGQEPAKETPGGKAIKAAKGKTKSQEAIKDKKELIENGNRAIGRAGRFAQNTEKTIKKAKAIFNTIKIALAAVSTEVWIIVGIILLAVILFAIFFGIFYSRRSAVPNPDGKSITIQADPVKDKDWIRKILMMSGDAEITKIVSEEFLNGLKNDLTTLKTQLAGNQDALTKIDAILQEIENAKSANGTNKKDIATKIKTDINALTDSLYVVSTFPKAITTKLPLAVLSDTSSVSFNNHPHTGTPGHPCTDNACNAPSGWPAHTYIQYEKNTCDAVDIKVGNDIDVFAAFGGKASIKDNSLWIEYADANKNKYTAVYAHINNKVADGATVKAGDKIGTTGSGHLHFELAVNDKCIVLTPHETDQAINQQTPVGSLLWAKIAKTLNLGQ